MLDTARVLSRIIAYGGGGGKFLARVKPEQVNKLYQALTTNTVHV